MMSLVYLPVLQCNGVVMVPSNVSWLAAGPTGPSWIVLYVPVASYVIGATTNTTTNTTPTGDRGAEELLKMAFRSKEDSLAAQACLDTLCETKVKSIAAAIELVKTSKCYHANWFLDKLIVSHEDAVGPIIVDKLLKTSISDLIYLAKHEVACKLFCRMTEKALPGSVFEKVLLETLLRRPQYIVRLMGNKKGKRLLIQMLTQCPSTKIGQIISGVLYGKQKNFQGKRIAFIKKCRDIKLIG